MRVIRSASPQEGGQGRGRVVRVLLGKEVAAFDGVARDGGCEPGPELERAAVVGVPGGEGSGSAPEEERGAGDPAAGGAVGGVVVAVDSRGRAILLADRVHVLAVLEPGEIVRPRLV